VNKARPDRSHGTDARIQSLPLFLTRVPTTFGFCYEFYSAEELVHQRPWALSNPNGRDQKKAVALLVLCPRTAQADVVCLGELGARA
jgi:hypothetical protein